MLWIVGFLDEQVKASLDAFPRDIRASFERIAELIQVHGLERCVNRTSSTWRAALGDADERQERHRPSLLCDGHRKARRRRSRLCKEDPEDTETRD